MPRTTSLILGHSLSLLDLLGYQRPIKGAQTQLCRRVRSSGSDIRVNRVHRGWAQQVLERTVIDLVPSALQSQRVNLAGAVRSTDLTK